MIEVLANSQKEKMTITDDEILNHRFGSAAARVRARDPKFHRASIRGD
jgi:hypothetical protein